jgi:hypothetical protein
MSAEEDLQLFYLSSRLINTELDQVEERYAIDLGRSQKRNNDTESGYYLQFPAAVRVEAAAMARHYRLFYCLENSICEMITDQLLAKHGEAWWDIAVPQIVRDSVAKNLTRERDAGVTLRSDDPIDYTTFGELGEIIQSNWDVFGDTFASKKAVVRVMSGLNLLRAPIAHSAPLADDEVIRLELAVRDWFRGLPS